MFPKFKKVDKRYCVNIPSGIFFDTWEFKMNGGFITNRDAFRYSNREARMVFPTKADALEFIHKSEFVTIDVLKQKLLDLYTPVNDFELGVLEKILDEYFVKGIEDDKSTIRATHWRENTYNDLANRIRDARRRMFSYTDDIENKLVPLYNDILRDARDHYKQEKLLLRAKEYINDYIQRILENKKIKSIDKVEQQFKDLHKKVLFMNEIIEMYYTENPDVS